MCNLATNPKLQHLFSYITCILSGYIIPLIFALAVVAFLWGVVNFVILGAGDETKKTQGRQLMIWGIIAITVMVGVWGLVKILTDTFNLPNFLPSYTPNPTQSGGSTSSSGCPPGQSLTYVPGPSGPPTYGTPIPICQ